MLNISDLDLFVEQDSDNIQVDRYPFFVLVSVAPVLEVDAAEVMVKHSIVVVVLVIDDQQPVAVDFDTLLIVD